MEQMRSILQDKFMKQNILFDSAKNPSWYIELDKYHVLQVGYNNRFNRYDSWNLIKTQSPVLYSEKKGLMKIVQDVPSMVYINFIQACFKEFISDIQNPSLTPATAELIKSELLSNGTMMLYPDDDPYDSWKLTLNGNKVHYYNTYQGDKKGDEGRGDFALSRLQKWLDDSIQNDCPMFIK
jgi:hypothetical protein